MNNDRLPVRGSTSQKVGAGMLALVAPFVIIISMFALAGIAPFGDRTVLCAQNADWFRDLAHWRSVLDGKAGLMYSFSDGLGADFYSRFGGGLCSPFLLFSLTMDGDQLPQSFVVVTLVRAAFAGFFAYLMLQRLSGRTPMSAAAFATAYASGSQLALSFLAPEYADAAVLLPLAAAGISLLAERGRATLFFCGATLFLLCCGRLWPLLIFFSIAYFVWCQLVLGSREGLWARLGLFIASIAAATGAAMVTLVPTFAVNSSLSSAIYPVSRVDAASLSDILGSMFAVGVSDGSIMPLLFCSTVTLLMLPLYILNSRLPLGERQVCALFLLLAALSMCIPALCWLWLGFSVPTGTVSCCGCVFCLFVVSAAVRLSTQPMRVKVSRVLLAWMICAGLFLVSLIFGSAKHSFSAIIFVAAFLTMYAAITIVALSGKGIAAGFCAVILVCVGCESALGGMTGLKNAAEELPLSTVTQQETQTRTQYDLESIVRGSEQNGASGFFRIRGADITGAGRIDTGTTTPECTKLMRVLGLSGSNGYTPVTDALFSVKYVVSAEGQSDYPSVGMADNLSVSRNDSTLALCLTTSDRVSSLTSFSTDPFTAQNELLTAMADADRQLFVTASLTERTGDGLGIIETLDGLELVRSSDSAGIARFTVLIPTDGPLYMFLGSPDGIKGMVSVGDGAPTEMDLSAINYIGHFGRGSLITVSVQVSEERLALSGSWFATMDSALTDTAIRQLAQQNASYITVDKNTVTCTATVSEGQLVMTTIPWQPGWRAFANGAEVDTVRVAGSLLGIDTGAGIHDLRLVYQPEDLTVSMIISITFLIFGFLLTCILDSDRLRRIYENSRAAAAMPTPEPPPQEDIFATYRDYMIPDIPSLDDQDDDFSDYFSGN